MLKRFQEMIFILDLLKVIQTESGIKVKAKNNFSKIYMSEHPIL